MQKEKLALARDLIGFIEKSPSSYHVIRNAAEELSKAGFRYLKEHESWKLEAGKGYFTERNGSSLIAFYIPEGEIGSVKLAAAHSDSPAFKVKPNGVMVAEKKYLKLNVEKYGGMIYSSWLDRPLSLAGRIVVDGEKGMETRLFHIDRDLLLIPRLAIHMNRQCNEGYNWNPQIDLLPLLGCGDDPEALRKLVAEEACVKKEDILGTDLFLYPRDRGTIWGKEQEFFSARALDDLACVYAMLKGFIHAGSDLSLMCIFDNEEAGSLTKQGADSTFLADVLDRLFEGLHISASKQKQILSRSFMISLDNGHGVHPNHGEKADPGNRPYLNGGVLLKFHANQKYTTDGVSEAVFRKICRSLSLQVQNYTNRSDIAGGSTLGNLSNRHVSVSTCDVGLPQLAMHSAYETAGVSDLADLCCILEHYYEAPLCMPCV